MVADSIVWAEWFVAVGTMLLAAATGGLAWFTYQVTKDSRDEITLERRRLEAAQRPIILPAEVRDAPETFGDTRKAIVLMNAGPGPALNIITWLDWGPPSGLNVKLPKLHMRPGGSAELFADPRDADWSFVFGKVVCQDLAGEHWRTEFQIRSEFQGEYVLDVQAPTRHWDDAAPAADAPAA